MRQLGPGDEIGSYRIEALAGRGGMGLVYRARQRRPDRTVAIKVIAPELAADPAFRARFEQESATAAEIEHPNVIPVYEVGDEDGLLFISMRFVQGVDLGRLLSLRGPLDPQRAAQPRSRRRRRRSTPRTRRGSSTATSSPATSSSPTRRPRVPDGLRADEADRATRTGMTQAGMYVGTVDYIAPEQVEGRRIDARADVYALGCVTYEMLSGSDPVPARLRRREDLRPRQRSAAAAARASPSHSPTAVQRAMAKRPEDRFQSAGDFGRAVSAGARRAARRAGRRSHGRERGGGGSREPTRRPSSTGPHAGAAGAGRATEVGSTPWRTAEASRLGDSGDRRRRPAAPSGPAAGRPAAGVPGPARRARTARRIGPRPALRRLARSSRDRGGRRDRRRRRRIGARTTTTTTTTTTPPTRRTSTHEHHHRSAADGEADLQPGQRERWPRRREPADRERVVLHELERDPPLGRVPLHGGEHHLRPVLLDQPDAGPVPGERAVGELRACC